MQRAHARSDAAMLADLAAIGAPPYAGSAADAVKSTYAGAPTPREAAAFAELARLARAALQGEPATASYLARGLPWPEPFARSLAVYTALRAEIVSFDARKLGRAFAVRMVFLQGADDLFTVTSEVEAYAAELAAPRVEMHKIAGAGHSAGLLADDAAARLLARVCSTA